jgi:hypothetical protein
MKQTSASLADIHKLIEQELFPEAIVSLEQLLDAQPSNKAALYWLSYSFIQLHHPIAAIEILSTYERLPEKEEHIESALLIAHFDSAHFIKAEEFATHGIQDFPLCAHFWRYKGFITARESPRDATPFFETAFALSPQEYPLPQKLPDESILQKIISWLPKEAQQWLEEIHIEFSLSPPIELLTQERFPQHPLSPFLLIDETLHIFLQNLRYLPTNQSAKSNLFEQLLALWNHLK